MIVSNDVYFGDISDLKRGQEIDVPTGGTIIYERNTFRHFIPGTYELHKLKGNAIIFSLETVDPGKINNYLLASDVGDDFRDKNYVNRYDWMHYRGFGEDPELADDYKIKLEQYLDHCFITTDNEFFKKDFKIHKVETNIYQVLDESSKQILSYICDIERQGEWNYGALLKDKDSDKYFAFIFQDEYTLRDKSPEDNLIKFDGVVSIADFYY